MKKADNKERRCTRCHTVIDKTKLYGMITEVTPLVMELAGKEVHEISYLCAQHFLEINYITK